MKLISFTIAFLLVQVLNSCDNNKIQSGEMNDLMVAEAPVNNELLNDEQPVPFSFQLQDTVAMQKQSPSLSSPPNSIDWDKKIIKTATVTLEVKNFSTYNSDMQEKVKKYGGYISKEKNVLTDYKSEIQFSIKVPVAAFEGLMNELGGAGITTTERSITTEDVTGQMVDTKSRMEAKKQVRLKYLEFLKQSKNMTEVLQVQAEINNLQEEIEASAGRMQYLSASSAFSTINLTVYQPLPGFEPVNTNPSFLARFVESFKAGADFFKDLIIGLTAIWPLILIIAGGLFFWKRTKRGNVVKISA